MNENNEQQTIFIKKILEWAMNKETDIDYVKEVKWYLTDVIDYRVAESNLKLKEDEISVDKLWDRITRRVLEMKTLEKQRENNE